MKIKRYTAYFILAIILLWVGALCMHFAVAGSWYFIPAVITYILSVLLSIVAGIIHADLYKDKTFTLWEVVE